VESGGELVRIPPVGDEDAGWTVLQRRIGETIGFVPTLRCFPRSWRREPDAWSAQVDLRRVRVESSGFDERYDARADVTQERNWLLQLLSPAFVTWLTERAPEGLGFELHDGTVRCFMPGLLEGEEAERLRAAGARVANRIREEALESEGLGVRELGSGVPERIEKAVAEVQFDAMPPDSLAASRPFRGVAARDPRVYVAALGGVVSIFLVLFVGLLQLDVDLISIVIDIVGWIGPKNSGIAIGVLAVAGWIGAIPGAIAIASRSYGRVAFAREYARAHDYRLESPQSFHRRLMKVDLSAPAEFVLRGDLDGERHGWLVLCRSRRGPFASYQDAVVLEAPDGATGLRAGLTFTRDDGYLVASRPSSADRSAAGLDDVVRRALAGAAQVSTSSTSPSGS
jgi:hypothetical protein